MTVGMNWVDAVVLAIIAVSGMLGLLRGLVREVLGLVAWVGAAFAATYFFPQAQGLARRAIANPDIADPMAFGAVFLLVLIVLSLMARTLGIAVRNSAIGSLDRTLGLLFGLARGAVIMVAAYLIAGVLEPVDRWPDPVLEARSLPSIYLGAVWAIQHVPEEYRPVLPVPPAVRPPAPPLPDATPAAPPTGSPPAPNP